MSSRLSTNSSDNTKKVRDSNIELLRILTMFGVILLHYNGGVGNALGLAQPGSITYWLVAAVEALFIGSVNIFMLISGYFSCTTQRRDPVKILQLLAQVVVFQVGLYVLRSLEANDFTVRGFIVSFMPVNYFILLYIVVYLVSPYINLLFKSLTEKQTTQFVLLLFVLFSVWPTIADLLEARLHTTYMGLNTVGAYGDSYGYTAVNFILMYIIGAYLRLYGLPKLKGWHLLLIAVGCIASVMVISEFTTDVGRSYCNPFVIILAVCLFQLFTKFSFRNAVVNNLSKACLTVFLFHAYPLAKFNVEKAVAMGPLYLLGHMLLTCVIIYLMSWVIHHIYDLITKPIFKLISKIIPGYEI